MSDAAVDRLLLDLAQRIARQRLGRAVRELDERGTTSGADD
jgi:hypothetical protein